MRQVSYFESYFEKKMMGCGGTEPSYVNNLNFVKTLSSVRKHHKTNFYDPPDLDHPAPLIMILMKIQLPFQFFSRNTYKLLKLCNKNNFFPFNETFVDLLFLGFCILFTVLAHPYLPLDWCRIQVVTSLKLYFCNYEVYMMGKIK